MDRIPQWFSFSLFPSPPSGFFQRRTVQLALCNADRVVMSVAIVPLSLANGWSRAFSGIVQSSFLWGYLVSPIGGGVLVDNYGDKVVMAWGVALWSLATFHTPWAAQTSLLAVLSIRALLGVVEGVAPVIGKILTQLMVDGETKEVDMKHFSIGRFNMTSKL